MALQFVFLLSVPTIGVAFLSVLFLIFAFGTLRMTSSQAMLTWAIATPASPPSSSPPTCRSACPLRRSSSGPPRCCASCW